MNFKLLGRFRELFYGVEYRHRRSNLGDQVSSYLYEDLFSIARSPKFVAAVQSKDGVINTANVAVGQTARRGDGTFGARVPSVEPSIQPGYVVAFGQVATVDIGIEVKVLAKAMIKQLDRVGTDMTNQAAEFRRHRGNPICIGLVGINCASSYTSFEGERAYPTNGRSRPHPIQEAAQAESRLTERVSKVFDEVIVLRFQATNVAPYPFEWVDLSETEKYYAASLLRISRAYESRF